MCELDFSIPGLVCEVSLDGTINVAHLGTGTMVGTTHVAASFITGCTETTDDPGTVVWTAANGDTINLDIVANVSCDGEFSGQYVVNGDDPGTGRFTEASGTIDVSGSIIPVSEDLVNLIFTSVSPDLEVSGTLGYW